MAEVFAEAEAEVWIWAAAAVLAWVRVIDRAIVSSGKTPNSSRQVEPDEAKSRFLLAVAVFSTAFAAVVAVFVAVFAAAFVAAFTAAFISRSASCLG